MPAVASVHCLLVDDFLLSPRTRRWALATLGLKDEVALHALAASAARLCTTRDVRAREVANALWACGASGVRDVTDVARTLAQALARLADAPDVVPQNIANGIW